MAAILVVDDEWDLAEMLAETLKLEGHQVRVAHDGEEGLRELTRWTPALVMLDVQMPRLDGPGMAHAMLVPGSGVEDIPIILMSGAPRIDDIARAVGTPYFLRKPSDIDRLLQLVSSALSERRPAAPARVCRAG